MSNLATIAKRKKPFKARKIGPILTIGPICPHPDIHLDAHLVTHHDQ
jgi:hypothetical protein